MEIDVVLCNHAEAVNNLLYISGGGINACYFPPDAAPPYPVTLGLGMLIKVPYDQTNIEHTVEVSLLGQDDNEFPIEQDNGAAEPLRVDFVFSLGRSEIPEGDTQSVAMAGNFTALPLPAQGRYSFAISISGRLQRRIPFRVIPVPDRSEDAR